MQSGFRVYPVARTLGLGVRARHFAFETEVLTCATRAGIAIESVPAGDRLLSATRAASKREVEADAHILEAARVELAVGITAVVVLEHQGDLAIDNTQALPL